jgi:hypothetical protein
MTATGKAYYTDSSLVGELVVRRTYNYTSSGVMLSIAGWGARQARNLDTAARRMGNIKLDENVAVFEKPARESRSRLLMRILQ